MNIKEFKKGVVTKISANFSSNEFDCKCFYPECDKTYIDLDHVKKLQKIRDKKGPVNINSAYRCPRHNKDVGGATNSEHPKGVATDITVATATPTQLYDELKDTWKGGLGVYDTFVHIDSRETMARWDLRNTTKIKK